MSRRHATPEPIKQFYEENNGEIILVESAPNKTLRIVFVTYDNDALDRDVWAYLVGEWKRTKRQPWNADTGKPKNEANSS